jgi:hypothetical protein
MTVQELVNQKFTALSAQLGALTLQQSELTDKISAVKSQIVALNVLVPDLRAMEAALKEITNNVPAQKESND